MAYYDEPLVDPTADFEAQEAGLTQQAARIKALRDRYGKPYTPDNTEVGGFTLSTGQRIPGRVIGGGWGQAAQALSPLVADFTAGQQEKAMNAQRGALSQAEVADAVKQMQEFPQATPGGYESLPGNKGFAGGNLVEANYVPGKDPSVADTGAAIAKMYRNPKLAKSADDILQYQMTKAPGEALTRALAAEDKRRKAFEADRTFTETSNYHKALLGKQGTSGFQDSKLTDKGGATIYAHPDGRAYSLNFPLTPAGEQTMPPEQMPGQLRMKPGTTALTKDRPVPEPYVKPAGTAPTTDPRLRSQQQSPPEKPSEQAQKDIEAAGTQLTTLQELRARRRGLPSSFLGDVLPTNWGKSDVVAWADKDAASRAGFHSDMGKYVNTELYDASGKAINEEEMKRIKATMPNAASTDDEWERWGERVEALAKMKILRRQEIAKNPKDIDYDVNVNALVNKRTGQIIPGTESPFKKEIDTDRAVQAEVAKQGEPRISAGADMATMKKSIEAMPDSLEKAMALRALNKNNIAKALPKTAAKASAAPAPAGAAQPADGLSTVEDGYRYTPGPGGRANKANWSKQ